MFTSDKKEKPKLTPIKSESDSSDYNDLIAVLNDESEWLL